MYRIVFAFLAFFPLLLSAADYDTLQALRPFTQQRISFEPEKYPDGIQRRGDYLVLGNGRIWLKKVAVPKSQRDTRASLRLSLASAGDPWDKAGSVFVLPAAKEVTMIEVADGKAAYPAVDAARYEDFRGFVAQAGYVPPVELLRFMTPFGVGAHNPKDSVRKEETQPHYIDGFADEVVWEADITDRLPLLTADSVYLGVTIDTWTQQGYDLSLSLVVEGSRLKSDKAKRKKVLPLVNTYLYLGQRHCDLFNRRPLEVDFTLEKAPRNAQLFYIVSGHGGHAGGDEFTPCENILRLDGQEVLRFTPWRTDCASFRRFNPSTGVWLKEREVTYITPEGKRGKKRIEEVVASSDKSRSNWCPGSMVDPEILRLPHLTEGRHTLSIDIPKAQAATGDRLNHWVVSTWLVWEE